MTVKEACAYTVEGRDPWPLLKLYLEATDKAALMNQAREYLLGPTVVTAQHSSVVNPQQTT